MPSPENTPFLNAIEILIPGERFKLGGPVGEAGGLPPRRMLESQAMRWTYVLRTRERWLGKGTAGQQHEENAARTLLDFGVDDAALQRIALASRVVVSMPYVEESDGWAGRVFPWEYVIAAATRRHRRASGRHFTVMRQLAPHATQRRFAPLLDTALQGRLVEDVKLPRLHLFFPDKSAALIGISDPYNSATSLMGIVRQLRRLKRPAAPR